MFKKQESGGSPTPPGPTQATSTPGFCLLQDRSAEGSSSGVECRRSERISDSTADDEAWTAQARKKAEKGTPGRVARKKDEARTPQDHYDYHGASASVVTVTEQLRRVDSGAECICAFCSCSPLVVVSDARIGGHLCAKCGAVLHAACGFYGVAGAALSPLELAAPTRLCRSCYPKSWGVGGGSWSGSGKGSGGGSGGTAGEGAGAGASGGSGSGSGAGCGSASGSGDGSVAGSSAAPSTPSSTVAQLARSHSPSVIGPTVEGAKDDDFCLTSFAVGDYVFAGHSKAPGGEVSSSKFPAEVIGICVSKSGEDYYTLAFLDGDSGVALGVHMQLATQLNCRTCQLPVVLNASGSKVCRGCGRVFHVDCLRDGGGGAGLLITCRSCRAHGKEHTVQQDRSSRMQRCFRRDEHHEWAEGDMPVATRPAEMQPGPIAASGEDTDNGMECGEG